MLPISGGALPIIGCSQSDHISRALLPKGECVRTERASGTIPHPCLSPPPLTKQSAPKNEGVILSSAVPELWFSSSGGVCVCMRVCREPLYL